MKMVKIYRLTIPLRFQMYTIKESKYPLHFPETIMLINTRQPEAFFVTRLPKGVVTGVSSFQWYQKSTSSPSFDVAMAI